MSITILGLRPQRKALILGVVLFVIAAATILAGFLYLTASKPPRSGQALPPAAERPSVKLPPPDLLRPISPEEALKENAQRAFSSRPDSPAVAFRLKTDLASSARAQQCLAQAVYYEAATEGADGQRAVAQIVLNRMRHRAYPASVCGVVYQGSERTTGCQFSFTCDGSLARIPSAAAWKQANDVARAALRGAVFAPVGHSSHYHAAYVLPYWADSLDKVRQIGRHIFYRLKGSLGSSRAFTQAYKGSEPAIPAPAPAIITVDIPSDDGAIITAVANPGGLRTFEGELVGKTTTEAPLADAAAGVLLSDGEDPRDRPISAKKPEKQSCRSTGDNVRLKPMSTSTMQPSEAETC